MLVCNQKEVGIGTSVSATNLREPGMDRSCVLDA